MQAAALELSRRVWEPLKAHLDGVATVLIAPDGVLSSFPLAALPGAGLEPICSKIWQSATSARRTGWSRR